MRTSETLLLDFIRQSPQFRIPVNQRRFAWTQRECRQLWEDILDAGERADVREHFLGPVMYLAAVDPLAESFRRRRSCSARRWRKLAPSPTRPATRSSAREVKVGVGCGLATMRRRRRRS